MPRVTFGRMSVSPLIRCRRSASLYLMLKIFYQGARGLDVGAYYGFYQWTYLGLLFAPSHAPLWYSGSYWWRRCHLSSTCVLKADPHQCASYPQCGRILSLWGPQPLCRLGNWIVPLHVFSEKWKEHVLGVWGSHDQPEQQHCVYRTPWEYRTWTFITWF